MKKKLLNSMRVLLVAAGLCVGANAWADDITAIPSTFDFSATDATTGPFDNSAIVSGTNIGNVLKVNQKATATAWIDVDAEAEGRQAYEIASNEKVTVALSVYHGWESNNRAATVSVYNPDGVSLASYVYNIKDCKITSVSFGGTEVSPFTAFGYKNDGNGTNNFKSGQQLDITFAISGSGYIETTFMNGSTNAGTFSSTLSSDVKIQIARIVVASTCDVDDRGYHIKSLALSSETVSDATITYKYEDTEGNSLASLKSDQTAPGSIESDIADVIPDGYKTTFYNEDSSIKYVYDSFACEDTKVPTDGTTVILKFKAFSKFTYNVKAVDSDNNELATIATTSGFAGESLSLYWSKYVKVGNVWFVANAPFYQGEISEAGEKRVTFTASDVAYFIECENMNGVRTDRWVYEENANNSGYKKLRINQYYSTIWTDTFAEGGVFDLSLPYNNSNASNSTYQIRTRDASGNLTDVAEWTCEGGAKTYTLKNIVIPAGSSLAICCDNISGNSNARMDYLTLTQSKVPVTIADDKEFATFNSDYALDFTKVEGLTAYTAMINDTGSEVTLTKVVGKVPANTGLLVRGTTANVPATVYEGAVSNDFIAVTADKCDEGQDFLTVKDGYVLATVDGVQAFYKANTTSGTKVSKGKAYLPSTGATGARLTLNFGGEATGVNDIRTVIVDNNIYNLNGVRVSQPTKGLYIVNGKKVVIK